MGVVTRRRLSGGNAEKGHKGQRAAVARCYSEKRE